MMDNQAQIQQDYICKLKENNLQKGLKYCIITFGCQMNEHDSEKLAGMLSDMGYSECNGVKDSDVIVYNTCCVRENAEQKVYGHLGSLKKLKKENPGKIIAVCGCMTQQEEVVTHIKRVYRHVDIVFGTHSLWRFPEMLYSALLFNKKSFGFEECQGDIVEGLPVSRKDTIKAWVNVMYGCNNFCSYCIVPYVRGRERSRDINEIVKEVLELGSKGYKEITLLGQNVNSYGNDLYNKRAFSELLIKLNDIDGIDRIRFMTSHPKDLSDDLIKAVRDLPKVCKHIHLPIQSGSTKLLKDMNRRYTKEKYLELVGKIKSEIPQIVLTTDIIVGFPGETEEDFLDTMDVLEKVRYDMAFTFLYSKRRGTPASKFANQISIDVMKERFTKLLESQNRISREINEGYLGKNVEVLAEGHSKNSTSIYTGRTDGNKVVDFIGTDNCVGKLVQVKIENIKTWSLEGKEGIKK